MTLRSSTADETMWKGVLAADREVVRRALEQGADPNALRERDQYSPLMRAARAGLREIVEMLVAAGADPNFVARDGYRPVTVTVDIAIVAWLLRAGAKLDGATCSALMYEFQGDQAIRELMQELGHTEVEWEDTVRQLFTRMLDVDGVAAQLALMNDAAELLPRAFDRLTHLRASQSEASHEDLWELYALSRVNDLLLTSLLAERQGGALVLASAPSYAEALSRVGLTRMSGRQFQPFFHEIVDVEQTKDPDAPTELIGELWPAFSFGELLFSRAGVRVRAGGRWIRKDIAETSTLYFTFRRGDRSVRDLSHDWGSNSQWRTAMRRDYARSDSFVYNVDGENDLAPGKFIGPDEDEWGLTVEERIELLTNRCFVRTEKPGSDFWPFDDTYKEHR